MYHVTLRFAADRLKVKDNATTAIALTSKVNEQVQGDRWWQSNFMSCQLPRRRGHTSRRYDVRDRCAIYQLGDHRLLGDLEGGTCKGVLKYFACVWFFRQN